MRIVLKANEGFVYTNNEIYGTTIYLAEGVSKDGFYQITKEEYERKLKEQESLNHGDEWIEDDEV